MAVNSLEIHPAAFADLKSAVAWYDDHSKLAGDSFLLELDRAINFILQSPQSWPMGKYSTRRFVLRRFPFAVIYRQQEPSIQIIAIAHGRRRPEYWKERL